MDIRTYAVGVLQTNCYLVGNADGLIIIDPGYASPALLKAVAEDGRRPEAILLTHGHFDHIMGIDKLKEAYDIPVYALEEERVTFENKGANLAAVFIDGDYHIESELTYFQEGELPEIAGLSFETFWVPGHSHGGCCYYLRSDKVLFSGDVLFQASVGRTDGPHGDMDGMIRALKEKILVLDPDTIVLPGHGPSTRIDYELRYNPYLQ